MRKQLLLVSVLISSTAFAVNFRENQSVIQRKTLIVNDIAKLEQVKDTLSESQYKSKYKSWKGKITGLSKRVCVKNGDCTIGANVSYDNPIKASITPYFERNGEVINFPNLAFPIHSKIISKDTKSKRIILIEDMYSMTDFHSYSTYEVERRRIYDDFSGQDIYTNKRDTVQFGDSQNSKTTIAFRSLDDSVYFERGYLNEISRKPIPSDYVYIQNGTMYSTSAYEIKLSPASGFNNSEEVESVSVEVLYSTEKPMAFTFNKVIGDGVYLKKDDTIFLANEDFSVDYDFSFEVLPDEGSAALYVSYGSGGSSWSFAQDNKEAIIAFLKSQDPEGKFDFNYRESTRHDDGSVTSYGLHSSSFVKEELGGNEYVSIFGVLSEFINNNAQTGINLEDYYINPEHIFNFLAEHDSLNRLRGIYSNNYWFLRRLSEFVKLSSDTFGSNNTFGLMEVKTSSFFFSTIEDQRKLEKDLVSAFEGLNLLKYQKLSLSRNDIDSLAIQGEIRGNFSYWGSGSKDRYKYFIVKDYFDSSIPNKWKYDGFEFKIHLKKNYKPGHKIYNSYITWEDEVYPYMVCNDLIENNYDKIDSKEFLMDLVEHHHETKDEFRKPVEKLYIKDQDENRYNKYYSGSEYAWTMRSNCTTKWSLVLLHPRYERDDDYGKFQYELESVDIFPKIESN